MMSQRGEQFTIPRAGVYDLRVPHYHCPILTGGFPQRTPVASSSRLRQQYLNTDTLSGRLVLSSAQARSRQRHLALFLQSLEDQARALEGNAPTTEPPVTHPPTSKPVPKSPRASKSRVAQNRGGTSRMVIPPINSSSGMTIIREKETLPVAEPSHQGRRSIHAEMSIYLPRAEPDDEGEAGNCSPNSHPRIIRAVTQQETISSLAKRRVRPKTAKW